MLSGYKEAVVSPFPLRSASVITSRRLIREEAFWIRLVDRANARATARTRLVELLSSEYTAPAQAAAGTTHLGQNVANFSRPRTGA